MANDLKWATISIDTAKYGSLQVDKIMFGSDEVWVDIIPWYGSRGVFGGGSTNVIDYITIQTTGDATDFGDLTVDRYGLAACSDGTRGVFGGGVTTNVIDYITIATTGNATDFGDLTVDRGYLASCSGT